MFVEDVLLDEFRALEALLTDDTFVDLASIDFRTLAFSILLLHMHEDLVFCGIFKHLGSWNKPILSASYVLLLELFAT